MANKKTYLCPTCKHNIHFCTCVGIYWNDKKGALYAIEVEEE